MIAAKWWASHNSIPDCLILFQYHHNLILHTICHIRPCKHNRECCPCKFKARAPFLINKRLLQLLCILPWILLLPSIEHSIIAHHTFIQLSCCRLRDLHHLGMTHPLPSPTPSLIHIAEEVPHLHSHHWSPLQFQLRGISGSLIGLT